MYNLKVLRFGPWSGGNAADILNELHKAGLHIVKCEFSQEAFCSEFRFMGCSTTRDLMIEWQWLENTMKRVLSGKVIIKEVEEVTPKGSTKITSDDPAIGGVILPKQIRPLDLIPPVVFAPMRTLILIRTSLPQITPMIDWKPIHKKMEAAMPKALFFDHGPLDFKQIHPKLTIRVIHDGIFPESQRSQLWETLFALVPGFKGIEYIDCPHPDAFSPQNLHPDFHSTKLNALTFPTPSINVDIRSALLDKESLHNAIMSGLKFKKGKPMSYENTNRNPKAEAHAAGKEPFFMLYSPQSDRPMVQTFDTAEEAWNVADEMARKHSGQRFFVMQALGSTAVEKPVVRKAFNEQQ